MTERPIYFKTFAEIEARPDFDPSCGISPETVTGLIGEYHCVSDEERPCQRQKADGRCGEGHRNGWLGRRSDGKEALIGWNCGLEHFKASAVFATERSRVTRELELDRLLERLEATAGNAEYRANAKATLERAYEIRHDVQAIRDRLPASVQQAVNRMARRGDAGVYVEYQYEKLDPKSDKPKLISDWISQRVGAIFGLKMWDGHALRTAITELTTIRDTLLAAVVQRDVGARKLRAWADALERLPHCKSTLDETAAAATEFMEPANLRWLCLVTSNHDHRLELASLVLKLQNSSSDRLAAEKSYRSLAAEIRGRADGRDFRVA